MSTLNICIGEHNHSLFVRAQAGHRQAEVIIVFVVMIFLSQMIPFFTAWTYPKTHQTWNLGHTWLKLLELCWFFFFFFFLLIEMMLQTYFFKLLPSNFTNCHKTLHTASVDLPDIKRILILQRILKLLTTSCTIC